MGRTTPKQIGRPYVPPFSILRFQIQLTGKIVPALVLQDLRKVKLPSNDRDDKQNLKELLGIASFLNLC